ncbi:DUF1203 domain-containing protein [Streptomyces montanisoli]|uniref:DUF1203 domain-containing protein n=1 Tax=Streptomyces montanisoli TaxID=2798581 RepID=UPI003558973A
MTSSAPVQHRRHGIHHARAGAPHASAHRHRGPARTARPRRRGRRHGALHRREGGAPLRRYDARGHIAGGRLFEIPGDADAGFDAALDEAFTDPDVALVHVRALEYGCFQFEVRRP